MDKRQIDNYTFVETPIKDLYEIEVKRFCDDRGYFMETYKESVFNKAGLKYKFVQENQSKSKRDVLRGLHFQKKYPQAKLVRCIQGEVFDVAVDLRKNSLTYGKWFGVILSSEKCNQLMIPRGFAHGFVVLSDIAIFSYMCDDFYHAEDESGIIWNDPDIGIIWPIDNPILSDKDKNNLSLKETELVKEK